MNSTHTKKIVFTNNDIETLFNLEVRFHTFTKILCKLKFHKYTVKALLFELTGKNTFNDLLKNHMMVELMGIVLYWNINKGNTIKNYSKFVRKFGLTFLELE